MEGSFDVVVVETESLSAGNCCSADNTPTDNCPCRAFWIMAAQGKLVAMGKFYDLISLHAAIDY
jgi:hypothetical protein